MTKIEPKMQEASLANCKVVIRGYNTDSERVAYVKLKDVHGQEYYQQAYSNHVAHSEQPYHLLNELIRILFDEYKK